MNLHRRLSGTTLFIAPVFVLCLAMLLGLSPSAKADTFIYNVTSTSGPVDVTFELPTFQESVTTSTFIQSTPTLSEFSLSGNSTGCFASGGSDAVGPCFVGSFMGSAIVDALVPAFTGPGTFTFNDGVGDITTVTITDVRSGVPEPSSLLLLGCGLFGLPIVARFGSRIRNLAR